MIEQIDAPALADQLRSGGANEHLPPVLLDVREPWEYEHGHIAAAVNIPMSTLAGRVDEVRDLQDQAARPLVVICHHGMRSMQCANFLAQQGLNPLVNLRGGMEAWSTQVDPSIPRY